MRKFDGDGEAGGKGEGKGEGEGVDDVDADGNVDVDVDGDDDIDGDGDADGEVDGVGEGEGKSSETVAVSIERASSASSRGAKRDPTTPPIVVPGETPTAACEYDWLAIPGIHPTSFNFPSRHSGAATPNASQACASIPLLCGDSRS